MDAPAESIKNTLQQWLEDRRRSLQEVLTVTLEEELGRLRPDDALVQKLLEPMVAQQSAAGAEGLERDLGAALDHLEKAPTQAEALKALMDGLHPLSERCALFIVKQGIANLFTHRGFESDTPRSGVAVVPPPELETVLNGAVSHLAGGPAYAALIKPLSPIQGSESLVLPLRLRRKVVALVLIDCGNRQKLDHPTLLRALVLAAESTLSHLAAASHEGTGSMPGATTTQSMPSAGPVTQPVPAYAPVPQPPVQDAAPHKITGPMAPDAARSSQPMTPPVAAPVAAPPGPPASAAAAVAKALDTRDLTPSVPTMVVPDPIPMPAPAGLGADDLDPKIRATAERLARVLLGDIELYYPQKVAQGRQGGNLYGLLREELDRSRHTFLERFGADVENRHRIFYNTVLGQLCEGDAKRLGKVPWD